MHQASRTLQDRFWDKVRVSGPDACWNWAGSIVKSGYGSMYCSRAGTDYAHRVSWRLHWGTIPDGFFVCHHCDNRACVNPAHLFLGTQADNMRDMAIKGRRRALAGAENARAKLVDESIPFVCLLSHIGLPKKDIGEIFGVSRRTVRAILDGTKWRHV